MNRCKRSAAPFALVAALGMALGAGRASAQPRPSLLGECADPLLPAEILRIPPAGAAAGLDVVSVRARNVTLRLAVAADVPTRELGLMCVTGLRPRHGMIFVFPVASEQPFWMKNTLIGLDMVWVGADGRVTAVSAVVPPSTLATPDEAVARRSGRGRYVIELRAGEAAADGIAAGVQLAVPPLRALR